VKASQRQLVWCGQAHGCRDRPVLVSRRRFTDLWATGPHPVSVSSSCASVAATRDESAYTSRGWSGAQEYKLVVTQPPLPPHPVTPAHTPVTPSRLSLNGTPSPPRTCTKPLGSRAADVSSAQRCREPHAARTPQHQKANRFEVLVETPF
jgi:hypothetical protein